MDNPKVLVYDSGKGGLNVFKILLKLRDFADFYYLSDSRFAPYGDRSEGFLIARATKLIRSYAENFSSVVLACNTLTTVAGNDLKRTFPHRFFGVSPEYAAGRTLLLCTPATAASDRAKVLSEKGVTVCAPRGLVFAIENNIYDIMKGDLSSFTRFFPPDDGFDNVILGCTHFIFLKDLVEKLYRGARISDGVSVMIEEFASFYGINGGILTTAPLPRKVDEKCFLGDDSAENFCIFKNMIKK